MEIQLHQRDDTRSPPHIMPQLSQEFEKAVDHLKGRERFVAHLDLLAKAYPKSYGRNRDKFISEYDEEMADKSPFKREHTYINFEVYERISNHNHRYMYLYRPPTIMEPGFRLRTWNGPRSWSSRKYNIEDLSKFENIPSYETIKDEWEKHTLVYNSVKNGQLIFKVIPNYMHYSDAKGKLMIIAPYQSSSYVEYQIYYLKPDRIEAIVER